MGEPTFTFPALLAEAYKQYPNNIALSFVSEEAITYTQLKTEVDKLSAYLMNLGVEPGDRVALLAQNMPNWPISYLATVSIGAVIVPLLPDFHADEIANIIAHSGSKQIFVSKSLLHKLETCEQSIKNNAILIDSFSWIEPVAETPEPKIEINTGTLAAIIYTSGTTGKSKGVMLSHENICFTAFYSGTIQPMNQYDRFLSILPLSHTYENSLGMVLPLMVGAAVYYLRKAPTPAVLLPAMKVVKPTVMLSVPLIIEKIHRQKVVPTIKKSTIGRVLYRFGPTRKLLHKKAGKSLKETFGGHLKFFGIGGAKLNPETEKFLNDAGFPYAIGYGLTETAPLLAGAPPFSTKLQSTGPQMQGVTLKINEPEKHNGEGEIWAKGRNVMLGYYNDEAATKEVITDDGWIKTGDLGCFDKDGYLFIKGRSKNVIIGSGGENIYPEEIESVINNFRFVLESLVVEKKGKLVAMVHFNKEEIETHYKHIKHEVQNYAEKVVEELQAELQHYVNSKVNKFSQIQLIVVQTAPFQKTATQKIKRYLYC